MEIWMALLHSMFKGSLKTEIPSHEKPIAYVTGCLCACKSLEMHPVHSITEKPSESTDGNRPQSPPNRNAASKPAYRHQQEYKTLVLVTQSKNTAPTPKWSEGCLFCQSNAHNVFVCNDLLLFRH